MNIINLISLEENDYQGIFIYDFSLKRNRMINNNILKSILVLPDTFSYLLNIDNLDFINISYQGESLLNIKRAYLLEAISLYVEKNPSFKLSNEFNKLRSKYSYYNLLDSTLSYETIVDDFKVKIPVKDFYDFLELDSDSYSLYTKGILDCYRGNDIKIFLYSMMEYFKSNDILGNYSFSKNIINRIKELQDYVIDYESINAINNYDPFLSGVKISKELDNILFTDNNYDMLTYIFTTYLKLCKIFTYSKDYYIDPISEKGSIHSNINRIESVSKNNNEIVCFEFCAIFGYFLNKLNIPYEVVNPNYDKNNINAKLEYGYYHDYIKFKLNDFLIKIDPISSVLSSDFTNVKIENTLDGFVCINKNQGTKNKFNRLLKNIYHTRKIDLDNIYLPRTKIENDQELSLEKKKIIEKLDRILTEVNNKDLPIVDKVSYLLGLLKLSFTNEELNLKINACLIHDKEDLFIVFTINDITYMNNDNTYLISDLNTLKIISKEELQEKINNNSYLYINERTIPGITSRKYV